MYSHFHAWIATREKGQGLVEYALILVLVAVVVVGLLALAGTSLQDTYDHVQTELSAAIDQAS